MRTQTPLDNPLAKQALGNPGGAGAARQGRQGPRGARASRARRARGQAAGRRRRGVPPDEGAGGAGRHDVELDARRASSSSSSGSSSGSARPPRPGTHDAQLAEWYRVLDLSAGADMSQIKTSYRQLMRKYHPDMHAGNPSKQKAATELSMRVTAAYNGLVAHLEKK